MVKQKEQCQLGSSLVKCLGGQFQSIMPIFWDDITSYLVLYTQENVSKHFSFIKFDILKFRRSICHLRFMSLSSSIEICVHVDHFFCFSSFASCRKKAATVITPSTGVHSDLGGPSFRKFAEGSE